MGRGPSKHYRSQKKRSSRKAKTLFERLKPFREFVCHFEWIHIGLGIVGNVAFLTGSIFFLQESLKTAGIGFFMLGSLGMLMGNVGSAIVKFERRQLGQD